MDSEDTSSPLSIGKLKKDAEAALRELSVTDSVLTQVKGVNKLKRLITKELRHCQRFSDDSDVHHSSNLPYFIGVLDQIRKELEKDPKGLVCVLRHFNLHQWSVPFTQRKEARDRRRLQFKKVKQQSTNKHKEENEDPSAQTTETCDFDPSLSTKMDKVVVDLVCDGGRRWIKVKACSAQSMEISSDDYHCRSDSHISSSFSDSSSIDLLSSMRTKSQLSFINLAWKMKTAAQSNQFLFHPPQIDFVFSQGISSKTAELLSRELNIVILPHCILDEILLPMTIVEDSSHHSSSSMELPLRMDDTSLFDSSKDTRGISGDQSSLLPSAGDDDEFGEMGEDYNSHSHSSEDDDIKKADDGSDDESSGSSFDESAILQKLQDQFAGDHTSSDENDSDNEASQMMSDESSSAEYETAEEEEEAEEGGGGGSAAEKKIDDPITPVASSSAKKGSLKIMRSPEKPKSFTSSLLKYWKLRCDFGSCIDQECPLHREILADALQSGQNLLQLSDESLSKEYRRILEERADLIITAEDHPTDPPTESSSLSSERKKKKSETVTTIPYRIPFKILVSDIPGYLVMGEYDRQYELMVRHIRQCRRVNVDVRTLISMISSMTHGLSVDVSFDKVLSAMVEDERRRPLLPWFQWIFNTSDIFELRNKENNDRYIELICSRTAWNRFISICDLMMGPKIEKDRLERLKKKIKIFDYNFNDYLCKEDYIQVCPSIAKFDHLKGKSVSQSYNLCVFRTGELLQIITLSANGSFIRAAKSQGVFTNAILHPVRALTEIYLNRHCSFRSEFKLSGKTPSSIVPID